MKIINHLRVTELISMELAYDSVESVMKMQSDGSVYLKPRTTKSFGDSKLLADTDTLDLDPRSFSQKLNIVEMNIQDEDKISEKKKITQQKKNKLKPFSEIIIDYSKSSDFGKPYTFTQENYDQFLLITIKNVNDGENNIGYLAISEKANDIRNAINERKIFVFRTALVVAIVILIFSLVLNRYFLKPIKTLVNFTKSIKEKNKQKTNIQTVKCLLLCI